MLIDEDVDGDDPGSDGNQFSLVLGKFLVLEKILNPGNWTGRINLVNF